MRLQELLQYGSFIVQCHDFPDADAIASGYGLFCYLKEHHKPVHLVYSGREIITKPNLKLMVELLNIPIEYVDPKNLEDGKIGTSTEGFSTDAASSEQEKDVVYLQLLESEYPKGMPSCLITVDCQYGEGNVTRLAAEHVAIIDHHTVGQAKLPGLTQICPGYGSCASLVWQMLREEGININDSSELATALYYGLYTDTNTLTEIKHPVDKDLRDSARFQSSVLLLLRNSNVTLDELRIAGDALEHVHYDEEGRFCVVQARECDPNILGFISDLAIQTDQVDMCVVFCKRKFGIKLSIRTCVPIHRANDVAHYILDGLGNGGGHIDKAGGFIEPAAFAKQYGDCSVTKVLCERMQEYCNAYEVIQASEYEADLSEMEVYQKKNLPVGYVELTKDVVETGTPILIRTLEADLELIAEDDFYVMVGIKGEVYPIRREKFEKSYVICEEQFHTDNLEYCPTIHDRENGEPKELYPYIRSCRSTGKVQVYAKRLERGVKVFTSWSPDRYMLGNPGDYLAVRSDDLHDVYVIGAEIFDLTYGRPE